MFYHSTSQFPQIFPLKDVHTIMLLLIQHMRPYRSLIRCRSSVRIDHPSSVSPNGNAASSSKHRRIPIIGINHNHFLSKRFHTIMKVEVGMFEKGSVFESKTFSSTTTCATTCATTCTTTCATTTASRGSTTAAPTRASTGGTSPAAT